MIISNDCKSYDISIGCLGLLKEQGDRNRWPYGEKKIVNCLQGVDPYRDRLNQYESFGYLEYDNYADDDISEVLYDLVDDGFVKYVPGNRPAYCITDKGIKEYMRNTFR